MQSSKSPKDKKIIRKFISIRDKYFKDKVESSFMNKKTNIDKFKYNN